MYIVERMYETMKTKNAMHMTESASGRDVKTSRKPCVSGRIKLKRFSGSEGGNFAIIRLAAAPTTDNPSRISPITYSRSCKTNDNKPPETVPRMFARNVDDSSTPLPFDKTCGCKISGIAPY